MITEAAFSSIEIKEFKVKKPGVRDAIRFFSGGLLLGIGVMLALGCNFGHVLGGIPELGISSIIALVVMVLGNWIGSFLVYNVPGEDLPVSTPRSV